MELWASNATGAQRKVWGSGLQLAQPSPLLPRQLSPPGCVTGGCTIPSLPLLICEMEMLSCMVADKPKGKELQPVHNHLEHLHHCDTVNNVCSGLCPWLLAREPKTSVIS